MQVAALAAALGGALLLTWTERIWPDVQEAMIGVVFVLAATGQRAAAREQRARRRAPARSAGRPDPVGAAERASRGSRRSTRCVLALWFGVGERLGRVGLLRAVRASPSRVSVQLVGLYLVFATLIVPPLATRRMTRHRLAAAWALGRRRLRAGLVLSTAFDLPSGPVIVWVLVALAIVVELFNRRTMATPAVHLRR